jgi:DNA-binding PadR family transcriptional regulator
MKPGSGYDIKRFCDKTISHFWNENFGHIYPVLKQLEKEELIEAIHAMDQDRKKVYQVTDKGRSAFYNWLVQEVEVTPPRSELLLKLSFGSYMPKDKVIEMLQGLKERYHKNVVLYKELEASYVTNEAARLDKAYPYWLSSLRYGIVTAEATLQWCEDTIHLLQTTNKLKEEE